MRGMQEIRERLAQARRRAGYDTPTAAARAFGWTESTYLAHENGTRGITKKAAERYARAFKCNLIWLMLGRGTIANGQMTVPVVGYLGAGEQVYYVDDHEQGAGMEQVDVPPEVDDTNLVALKIKGGSMRPLREGWVVYYRRDQDGVPHDALNDLCVVRLADGQTLLKELRRGYTPGRYNLLSWTSGAEPLEDQEVEWAARVLWIRPD